MIARPVALFWAALLALVVLTPAASAAPSGPSPKLGRSFVVGLVSGTVLVKPPGSARASRLTEKRVIPVGSTVNATKGKVKLVGALNRRGRNQSGVFSRGAFVATQARRTRAIIDMRLTGGSFADCGTAAATGATARASARLRLGRRLLGNAHGRFRTRGSQGAATVRGTKWLTEDRCNSTAIASRKGEVVASNGTSTYVLDDGDVFVSSCTPADVPPSEADLCLASLSDEVDNIYAFAIATEVHQGDYTVCVSPPTGDPLCKVYRLPEPEPGTDYRLHALGCAPDRGAGTYTTSWAVGGQFLGSLQFNVINPFPPGQGFCPVSSEELDQMQGTPARR